MQGSFMLLLGGPQCDATTDEVGRQAWNEGVYSYSPVNTPLPMPAPKTRLSDLAGAC